MATKYLGGKVDVSMNGVTIPAALISDDGVETTLEEDVQEIKTMAGTFQQPTGMLKTAESKFSVLLKSMDQLKTIFPDLYEAGTAPQTVGRIGFGGNTCVERENTPVVVHYSCEANSDNDVYIPNGAVVYNASLKQNASDPVKVEITVQALPDDAHDGKVAYYGTGSLTQKTLWNPVTKAYEPISS